MKKIPDKEIIEHLRSGDAERRELGFRHLYRQAHSLIESLVVKQGGTPDDTVAVFHDGLLLLERKLLEPGFELTSALNTYLYGVCRFKWLEELRRRGKNTTEGLSEGQDFPATEGDAFEKMVRKERIGQLVEIFQAMDEACRKILLHAYYLNCSRDKIARIMGLANADVAKSKVWKCKKKFIKLFMNRENQ